MIHVSASKKGGLVFLNGNTCINLVFHSLSTVLEISNCPLSRYRFNLLGVSCKSQKVAPPGQGLNYNFICFPFPTDPEKRPYPENYISIFRKEFIFSQKFQCNSNVNTAIYPYSLNKFFLVRIACAFRFISYNRIMYI